MRVLVKGFSTLGTTLPSIVGRYRYFSDIFQVPFIREVPIRLSVMPSRMRGDNFTGSRTKKLKEERKQAAKLETQLEKKYGVSLKPDKLTPGEWMRMNYFVEFLAFQSRLGIEFNDNSVLMRAFAHPSFTEDLEDLDRTQVEQGTDRDLKRRLKLESSLSESVSYPELGLRGYELTSLTIKEELYRIYPNITPFICNRVTEFLMSRETITEIATGLAINDLILLSREFDEVKDVDQELHLTFSNQDLVCDTFFSVIGAITNDLGEEAAKSFLKDFLITLVHYEDLSPHVTTDHPEAQLGQILQLNGVSPEVEVRTIAETGMVSEFPVVFAGVYCNGQKLAHGAHVSVKRAKNDALHNAIFGLLEGDISLEGLKETHIETGD